MNEVFRNILNASVQGGIVIAVVMVLRLLLKKAPRRYICLLWILAGLRLLIPFSIESELSLQPVSEPITREVWESRQDYGLAPFVQDQLVPPVQEEPDPGGSPGTPYVPDAEPAVDYHLNWTAVLPYLWLIPVMALAIYCVASYIRLKRRVREAVKLTEDTFESGRIDTAFILGYFVPRIYLPMGMDSENRDMILAHERTHLKNGDHWVKLVGFIALAIHWFNPLVWAAYICLCRDIELACDERVIRDMDLKERKSYSAALLSCCANRSHFAACPVAFGEKPVRKRILAVLNYRRPGFWITVVAVLAVVVVAVCFLTNPMIDPLTLENWGVTMTAVESSTTGVTVAFDLPEKAEGNFIFNMSDWTVQMESGGEWVDIPMLPQEEPDVPWNGKVSMLFPNEDVQRIALDWTAVYGEMPPGRYRVRGTLMLNQDGYGYKKDFYAAFRIRNGNVDSMTSDAWTDECRTVLHQIQSGDNWHIRVEREFEGEIVLDKWNRSEYWRSGENLLHILHNQSSGILDGVQYDGIYGDLCLDGEYYSGFSTNQQMTWHREEKIDISVPWLVSFDMDTKDVEAVSRKDTDDGYEIRLMVYGDDDPDLDYDSYYVDFFFDYAGDFRYAIQYVYGTGELMGKTVSQSKVSTMYAYECTEEEFQNMLATYADNLEIITEAQ